MNSLEDGIAFARDKGLLGRAQEGVAIESQALRTQLIMRILIKRY